MAQTINLNMLPKGIPNVVNVSQFDVGREIVFKLYDEASVYTIPTGATVIIAGRKGDNNVFSYNATILDGRHSVKVVTTNQMTACAGENLCQLRVTKSGIDLATVNFTMFVQERPDASGSVSQTDIPAIVSLASEQELNAEAWAVGTKAGVPVGSGDEQYENNAKHYAEEAESWAETFTGGTTYKDAIPFASIPVSGMQNGDLYNITDSFTTDSRFSDGSGHYHEAGTNIVWNNTKSKWDVAGGIGVRSVDSILSVESTNPVQNKLITVTKANALPFSVELSGNPITFNADAQAVQKLSVDLGLIQDLHGYPNPWVGGAGKNKLPMIVADLKSINTYGTWDGNTYTIGNTNFELQTDSGGNIQGIYITGAPSSGFAQLYFLGKDNVYQDAKIPTGTYTVSTNIGTLFVVKSGGTIVAQTTGSVNCNFDSSETYRIFIRINHGTTTNIKATPMIRLATESDATFEPYTNFCPIIGRTETGAVANGKNFIGYGTQLDGYIGSQGTFQAVSGTVGYLFETKNLPDVITYNAVSGNRAYYAYFDTVPVNGTSSPLYDQSTQVLPRTISVNKSYKYIHLQLSYNAPISNVQVEEGETATAYEPYKTPHTASIVFGQTIYVCKVDFKTGRVTILWTDVDMGSLSWTYNSSGGRFESNIWHRLYSSDRHQLILPNYTFFDGSPNDAPDKSYTCANNNTAIYIKDSSYSGDATALDSDLTGVSGVYRLAESYVIEIQLAPAELELLRGYNYITADGDMEIAAVPENVIQYIIDLLSNQSRSVQTVQRSEPAEEQPTEEQIEEVTEEEPTEQTDDDMR